MGHLSYSNCRFAGPPRHARVGYMGHLFLMSTALQECKSQEAAGSGQCAPVRYM